MKIKLVEADAAKIKELENGSAFTWEGMTLDEENISQIANIFVEEKLVKEDTAEITGYYWFGALMNELYSLTGENRYSDDLPFLSFEHESFDGTGSLSVFKMMIGARWLDDIVRNNALNEESDTER